ncbi:hypothetical protein [Enterococcus sp. 5H]|uniref:hypothetical protein n=1 Tax=Enterococcus sp. 5H TaxID=1229490 RepID=UPI0023040CFF|nr:hypothetical protein [Enterococcus sp. 5H]MDA9470941.1 hypothetical protein [Enterococcus sp. 5H]
MPQLDFENSTITFAKEQTEKYSVKLDDQTYIENIEFPCYFIGVTTLSFFEFYQADSPHLAENDYVLTETFQQIITRFPHTNAEQIRFVGETYVINQVPVYIETKDYLLAKIYPEKYSKFLQKVSDIEDLQAVSKEELVALKSYKRKRLLLEGTFGSRELLIKANEKNGQLVQDKLEYVNELYSFAHYSYAAMVQFLPEYGITNYDQFHEAYGKYIYSFTITKNGQTIPLLWPDYLYHKPENHLEFGLLANTDQKRYQSFNSWVADEEVIIEILATGFEDVYFKAKLKQPMTVKPQLSQSEYLPEETICLAIDSEIIEELKQREAHFEVVTANRTTVQAEQLNYELSGNQLLLPSRQLGKQGRYQLKVFSKKFGQLLVLFTIKREGLVKE